MKYFKSFIFAAILFANLTLNAQKTKTMTMVKVKSLPHLLENIKSDTKLILNLEHYKLEEIIKLAEWDAENNKPKNIKGERYEVIFSSWTAKDSADTKILTDAEFYIEINWIENFQIVGRKTETDITKVTSSSAHNNLFVFKNSKNVLLRNFRLGHWPEKGYCDGDVISFEECENITIDNCELFGSGLTGLVADRVKNLKLTSTTIEDCSENIMKLTNSLDVLFESCTFQNTEGQIVISNSHEYKNIDPIAFNECTFSNLKKPVFVLNITEYETIKVNNCVFYGIEEEEISNQPKMVEQKEKNKFKKAKK